MNPRRSALLGTIVVLIVVLGLAGARYFGTAHFHAFSVIATGLVTFFGILGIGPADESGELPERRLRAAITAGLMVSYLVLVGLAAFIRESDELSDFTRTLLSSFTSVVGVVVAFYFGASAYVEARNPRAADDK